jgi:hypothetical protein
MWNQESLGLVSWISLLKIYLSLSYKETENVQLLLRCAYCARRKSPFSLFLSKRLKPNYRIVQAIFPFSFKKAEPIVKKMGDFILLHYLPFVLVQMQFLWKHLGYFVAGLRVTYLLSLLHSL